MSELIGFPMKNQTTTILDDGSLDPNGSFDCVAESIASCLQYLTGKRYEGGWLKEAAYGAAYQGPTSAESYIAYCAAQGVTLAMSDCGTYANAVHAVHQLLAQGVPVVFTEQDDYAPLAFRGSWSHVCAFHADTENSLVAMDPFIAQDITYSDDVWSTRLRSSQVWTLEKIATPHPKEEEIIVIGLDNATVAGYFEASGDMWKCKQTDKVIGNAILSWYRLYGNSALNGLTYLGLPLTSEIGVQSVPGATYQRFERGVVVYDEAHKIDKVPGAGAVYLAHIYDGIGIDPRITQLKQQLTDATKQINAQPDIKTQAELTQAQSRINQMEELIKSWA